MSRHSSNKIGGPIAAARTIGPMASGTYTGAELAMSSARPGAYDASRIPSLIHGQRVSREQQRADLLAPLPAMCPVSARPATRVTVPEGAQADPIVCASPAPPPPPAPPPKVDRVPAPALAPVSQPPAALTAGQQEAAPPVYVPRESSAPGRVLKHLEGHGGGPITYRRMQQLFGIAPNTINAVFKRCLATGLVVKVRLEEDGHMRAALALAKARSAAPAASSSSPRPPLTNSATAAETLVQMKAVAAQGRHIIQLLDAGIQHLQELISSGAATHAAD